jgi:hypothetical protein
VIYEHLGEGQLALETLKELGDYVPALIELSKSWLLIAQKKYGEGLSTAVIQAIGECLRTAAK